jgi:hypothetical protein
MRAKNLLEEATFLMVSSFLKMSKRKGLKRPSEITEKKEDKTLKLK